MIRQVSFLLPIVALTRCQCFRTENWFPPGPPRCFGEALMWPHECNAVISGAISVVHTDIGTERCVGLTAEDSGLGQRDSSVGVIGSILSPPEAP